MKTEKNLQQKRKMLRNKLKSAEVLKLRKQNKTNTNK